MNLDEPLSWSTATGEAHAMLERLQANILKGHVRDHVALWFLRYPDGASMRAGLRALSPHVKSALTHLREVEAYRATGAGGSAYVGVGVSADGYRRLGTPPVKRPADASFAVGAKVRASALGDPPPARWEKGFRGPIHVVVVVGDRSRAGVDRVLRRLRPLLGAKALIVKAQRGQTLTNAGGQAIEHFGYVDGRSQPLFLTEDIADECANATVPSPWNPAFPLRQVLTPDPAGGLNHTLDFGSYFVFRKLEQDVAAFTRAEAALAEQLGMTADGRELAGAMIVGRFKDGTPVVHLGTDGEWPTRNDFTYVGDPAGARCPLHAHTRKTNPRGSGGFESVSAERAHLFARRGQTYGRRVDDPSDHTEPKPSRGVGLLFMAFNADIANQFEFIQGAWANSPSFPAAGHPVGIDPVIGNGARGPLTFPDTWGASTTRTGGPFRSTVTLKGAEYFFMPALTSLASL